MSFFRNLTLTTFLATLPAGALQINFNPAAGTAQNAIDGFERAGAFWESVLADNITVNIDINFEELDPGILGGASSATQGVAVENYFTALGLDITTADDATAVANLPTLIPSVGPPGSLASINFLTQVNTEGGSTVVSLDDDGSGNNSVLSLNTANAKALGLRTANDAATDASISFSNQFAFDFDNSDGIDSGRLDFVGIAIHEIGHALGFVSGVDTVDFAIENAADLENFRIFSGLDIFRYSGPDELNLAAGGDPFFSIDGGDTSITTFSTGVANGDGFQASHWEDGLGIGILDPTSAPPGFLNIVTATDLLAFDVIGFDVIPEPTSILLGAFGLLFFTRRRVA